jgi:hypothetical protein
MRAIRADCTRRVAAGDVVAVQRLAARRDADRVEHERACAAAHDQTNIGDDAAIQRHALFQEIHWLFTPYI